MFPLMSFHFLKVHFYLYQLTVHQQSGSRFPWPYGEETWSQMSRRSLCELKIINVAQCTPFSIVSFYVSSRTKQQCGYQDNGRDSCCYSSQILHQLESHPDNVLCRDLGQSHKSKEKVSMLFSKTWNKISISNYIKIIVFLTAFLFDNKI